MRISARRRCSRTRWPRSSECHLVRQLFCAAGLYLEGGCSRFCAPGHEPAWLVPALLFSGKQQACYMAVWETP